MSSRTPAERILAVAQTLPNPDHRAEIEQSVAALLEDLAPSDQEDALKRADRAIAEAEAADVRAPNTLVLWQRATALVLRAKIPDVETEPEEAKPAGRRRPVRDAPQA